LHSSEDISITEFTSHGGDPGCDGKSEMRYIGTVFVTDTSTSLRTVHTFVKPAIAMGKKWWSRQSSQLLLTHHGLDLQNMPGLGMSFISHTCYYKLSDVLIVYNRAHCELYYDSSIITLFQTLTLRNIVLSHTFFLLFPDMSLSVLYVEKYIGVVNIGMATKIQRMQQYEQRFNMSGQV
jgi:hypothetical protein